MKVETKETPDMIRLEEIRSFIICELDNQKAPTWVRPQHIWEPRWSLPGYEAKKAIEEARNKIIMFVPMCAEHLTADHSVDAIRRAI